MLNVSESNPFVDSLPGCNAAFEQSQAVQDEAEARFADLAMTDAPAFSDKGLDRLLADIEASPDVLTCLKAMVGGDATVNDVRAARAAIAKADASDYEWDVYAQTDPDRAYKIDRDFAEKIDSDDVAELVDAFDGNDPVAVWNIIKKWSDKRREYRGGRID